ncbi:methane monooxygenase [Azoarcus sp. DD4]|nr:methane monooxygenase [Azoarcus sp. DD4]
MGASNLAVKQSLKAHPVPSSVDPQEVHKWLQDFTWDFKAKSAKYPTKYDMDVNTREQFKLTAKEYARMESVKEERQYGTLLDGLDRLDAGNKVHPKWGEFMKLISNFLETGEYGAIAGSALLWDTAQSPEQKNGYLAQVIDEIRHVNQTAYVNYYYGKHYYDPAGHTNMRQLRAINPLYPGVKRAFGEGFLAGDAVESSINLQLVGEACFTNPLIVSLTEWAAANGDEITPTVFLSIETDELRHMANGYQTIVSIMNNPETMKYLQTDLDNAFWTQHKFLTPFVGAALEYGSKYKVEPWAKSWNRWVYEDWAGIWLGRLQQFGVKTPRCLADAKKDAVWSHHDLALLAYALWPLTGIRMELPDQQAMDWFEANYPGWYNHYGKIYEEWRALGFEDPKAGFCGALWMMEHGHGIFVDHTSGLPFCPTLGKGALNPRFLEANGKRFAFSEPYGERMWLQEPERYEFQNFFEQFEGWELSDLVKAAGGVRSDGKTLMAQPHLRDTDMWTLDDLKRINLTIPDPMKILNWQPVAA